MAMQCKQWHFNITEEVFIWLVQFNLLTLKPVDSPSVTFLEISIGCFSCFNTVSTQQISQHFKTLANVPQTICTARQIPK